MPNDTIASNTTLTLTAPLASGTNIEFLNDSGDSGFLIIEPSAIQVDTVGSNPPTLTGAGIGGDILNFQPGDMIAVLDVDQVFANLNVDPANAGDNATFDTAASYGASINAAFYIAPDGSVTDNFSFGINSVTEYILDDIRDALFGTAGGNAVLTLALANDPATGKPGAVALMQDAANPCFAAGTHILTTSGDIAVETVKPGDVVITWRGDEREVVWVGCREIDIARHPRPEAVLPVIIEAGALGENTPRSRLVLSPDHALFLDGVLVQAKDLQNGVTIRQTKLPRRITYFHIELECHDILFAEGAPAESYLDTGHRGVFDNADEPLILHPDLMQLRRAAEGCAPLCMGGETLFRIRQRLAERLPVSGVNQGRV
jgi:hypothetical protein